MSWADWLPSVACLAWLSVLGALLFVVTALLGLPLLRLAAGRHGLAATSQVVLAAPLGIAVLTAAAYVSLLGDVPRAVAALAIAAVLAWSVRSGGWAVFRRQAGFRPETLVAILAVGFLLGLSFHGPMLATDGGFGRDQLWYVAQVHAMRVDPLHLPELTIEGSRHTFARSAPVMWAAALAVLPMTDPAPFFAASLPVFALCWVAVAFRAMRNEAQGVPQTDRTWVLVAAMCVGSKIFSFYSVDSPPIALAVPAMLPLAFMVVGVSLPLTVTVPLLAVMAVVSFFSKVFAIALVVPVGTWVLYQSMSTRWGRGRALWLLVAGSAVFAVYVVAMLYRNREWIANFSLEFPTFLGATETAIWWTGIVAFSLLMLRHVFAGQCAERVMGAAFLLSLPLIVGWTVYFWIVGALAGVLYALVVVVHSPRGVWRQVFAVAAAAAMMHLYWSMWFPGPLYGGLRLLAPVLMVAGAWLAAGERAASARFGVALIAAALLMTVFASAAGAAAALLSAGINNAAMLAVPLFSVAALYSQRETVGAVRLVRLVSVGFLGGLALSVLAMMVTNRGPCNFSLAASCNERSALVDVWRKLATVAPADSLTFVSGSVTDLTFGNDYLPAISERQSFLSAWNDNGVWRGDKDRLERGLATKAAVLRGETDPAALSYSRSYSAFFAVKANAEAQPPRSSAVYRNGLYSIYRLETAR